MYNVRVKRFGESSVQVQFYDKVVVPPEVRYDSVTGEIFTRKRWDGRREMYNPFMDEYERLRDISDEEYMHKLKMDSTNRSINVIYDIARSNRWDWFLTFTFSSDYVDRYDYQKCSKKLSLWLNNVKKRGCRDMKYLIVPEQHKDGAWHFHGLFSDCEELDFQESGHYDNEGRMIYNVGRYNWGYTTATQVGDSGKASSYLCKYVTKELVGVTHGKKRYWASRNCQRPVVEDYIFEGTLYDFLREYDREVKNIKKVATPYNQLTYIEF